MAYLISAFISGFVTGSLIGIVPLIFGINKQQKNLGIISILVCAISGGILGALLAIPVAVLCSVIIFMKAKDSTKKCPHCAEDINKEAMFCKHCQQSLV